MSQQTAAQIVLKPRRLGVIVYAVLVAGSSLLTLLCLIPIPLLVRDGISGALLVLLIVSLLTGWFSYYCLSMLQRLRRARIVIGEEGLLLDIPDWAGGLCLEGEAVQFRWSEIYGITHDRPANFSTGGIVTDIYTIHSARGSFTFSKGICARPEMVAKMITAKTGLEMEEIGEAALASNEKNGERSDQMRMKLTLTILASIVLVVIGIVMSFFSETALVQAVETFMKACSYVTAAVTVVCGLVLFPKSLVYIFKAWRLHRQDRLSRRGERSSEI